MLHRRHLASFTFSSLALIVGAGLAGCSDDPAPGTTSTGSSSSSSGAGGQGGGGTGGVGGEGGTGGMGGVGGGMGGTGGVGGIVCEPVDEVCGDNIDNNCDGQTDEGCCTPGSTQACYTGPDGTMGVGACKAGVQTCSPDGLSYGPCVGEVVPGVQTCGLTDEDCNGVVGDGAGCLCTPGNTMPCYTGPAGTKNVGICKEGTATCAPDGLSYGACAGQVLPQAEACNAADDDCDSFVDDGASCACAPNSTKACYTGPMGTSGVGLCKSGVETCAPDGSGYGPCTGEVLPTPENCATTGDDDCNGQAPACTGDTTWVRTFGNNQNQIGLAVATDAQGNGVFVGRFSGAITLPAPIGTLTATGNDNLFVIKYNSTGTVVWAKKYGDAAGQDVTSVAIDSAGDVLIAGEFLGTINFGGTALTSNNGSRDIFVAKLAAATGDHVWSQAIANAYTQEEASVAVDAADNVYVSGTFSSNLTIGANVISPIAGGGLEVFVAKLNKSGTPLWAKAITGPGTQYAYDLAVSPAGDIALAGAFQTSIDFGGGKTLTSAGGYDIFVAKLDTMGNPIFVLGAGDGELQRANAVALDSAGNVLVTGEYNGSMDLGNGTVTSGGSEDVFIAKYSPSGFHMWSKAMGGVSTQRGKDIAVDPFNNVIVTGQFWASTDFGKGNVSSNGEHDIFVAKYNPAGTAAWTKKFGGGLSESGETVAADGNAAVWLGGSYRSTNVLFGDGNFTVNNGQEDVVLIKMAQ
ncbi:MopE-related protein [Polyangium jinanense]|uniref:Beta-propeller repeat-containing protein n=1 Tax=Polyangium jinanense TaxID=2829994 RepID=A0A9X3X298_9BACT|nr:MopE-related protein [Polyangium jinanense]MDC3954665.1 hypothetical protein [Polyangium jinanense]MDC3980968.1 hypothetical protein [Polyangium jinanense]